MRSDGADGNAAASFGIFRIGHDYDTLEFAAFAAHNGLDGSGYRRNNSDVGELLVVNQWSACEYVVAFFYIDFRRDAGIVVGNDSASGRHTGKGCDTVAAPRIFMSSPFLKLIDIAITIIMLTGNFVQR